MFTAIEKFTACRRKFVKDEGGAVALIFGLVFFAMLVMVGMAVDVARAYYATNKTLAALDAAALAAAKGMKEEGLNDAEIQHSGRGHRLHV